MWKQLTSYKLGGSILAIFASCFVLEAKVLAHLEGKLFNRGKAKLEFMDLIAHIDDIRVRISPVDGPAESIGDNILDLVDVLFDQLNPPRQVTDILGGPGNTVYDMRYARDIIAHAVQSVLHCILDIRTINHISHISIIRVGCAEKM